MKYDEFLCELKQKERINNIYNIFKNCTFYDFLPSLLKAIDFRIEELESVGNYTQRFIKNHENVIVSAARLEIQNLQNLKAVLLTMDASKYVP